MDADAGFMARALELAERGRGFAAPNPRVGAVLVRDGRVVAEGWHKVYGGPHAEVECLRDAEAKGVDPAGCTIYVTLEPCNHFGKTPPCSRAILDAGIRRVVIGCLDPNPEVLGGGATFLREHGVDVLVGVLERECRDATADFVVWKTCGRPFVTVKLAMTLDGRIATRTGDARWVSGEKSRQRVHEMRACVQAVLVGGGTFRADNPALTHRFVEGPLVANPQPLAVVLGRELPEPDAPFSLLRERPEQLIFLTDAAGEASARATALAARGVRVWGLPELDGVLDLGRGLARLREEEHVYSLLCEGGGELAGSLLSYGLMDELVLFCAPKLLADAQGVPVFSGMTVPRMKDAAKLRFLRVTPLGEDIMIVARPDNGTASGGMTVQRSPCRTTSATPA